MRDRADDLPDRVEHDREVEGEYHPYLRESYVDYCFDVVDGGCSG